MIMTVQEMVAAEQAAIQSGTPEYALMQHAGEAVAQAIDRSFSKRPVLVLAGTGNNGGDGLVAAEYLRRAGWQVAVALLGEKTAFTGSAAQAANAYQGAYVAFDVALLASRPLVVDALFGTGLSRDITGVAAEVLQAITEQALTVVAVDIPSGVEGNTGQVRGIAAPARLTLTFHSKKPAHVLQPGRRYCGDVQVVGIGLAEPVTSLQENDPSLWQPVFPWANEASHKYSRGHAYVQGGDIGYTGAAKLSARAALRAGAGAVSVICTQQALPIYAAGFEAIMTRVAETSTVFTELLADKRISAVLIGPAAGVNDDTCQRVLAVLHQQKPTVLDADALTVFVSDPQTLFSAIGQTPVVLTPHEGEFTRLFAHISGDKISRARQAATRANAIVLLKGADTVIAAPDGRAVVNTTSSPYLATAGSGDVLAGILTGLLAGGMPAFEAACAGAWLHGMAAAEFGPGLIADDIPDLLPAVLQFLRYKGA